MEALGGCSSRGFGSDPTLCSAPSPHLNFQLTFTTLSVMAKCPQKHYIREYDLWIHILHTCEVLFRWFFLMLKFWISPISTSITFITFWSACRIYHILLLVPIWTSGKTLICKMEFPRSNSYSNPNWTDLRINRADSKCGWPEWIRQLNTNTGRD